MSGKLSRSVDELQRELASLSLDDAGEESIDLSEEELVDLPDYSESMEIMVNFSALVKSKKLLEFPGNFIAGVSYPTTASARNSTLLIFFAPSSETDIENDAKAASWNPFKQTNGNWVKSFMQLQKAMGGFPFDEYLLLDLLPMKIWRSSMVIQPDEWRLSLVWLINQIKALRPTKIYVANKGCWKKRAAYYSSAVGNIPVEVVSHPGYTNRNRDLVTREWRAVRDAAEAQ